MIQKREKIGKLYGVLMLLSFTPLESPAGPWEASVEGPGDRGSSRGGGVAVEYVLDVLYLIINSS